MSYHDLALEDRLLRYFQNKEIIKERREENKLLEEEIEQHFAQSSEGGRLVFELPNGEWAVLEIKSTAYEEFDRDGLACELLVAKDELKTPYDFTVLTAQGKLTPDMVKQYTGTRVVDRFKMKKRKTKPR